MSYFKSQPDLAAKPARIDNVLYALAIDGDSVNCNPALILQALEILRQAHSC